MSSLEIHFQSRVYKVGETITGTVLLKTNVDIPECTNLVITLSGLESVKWEDVSLEKRETNIPNVIYENDHAILEIQQTLWTSSGETITQGEYQYPFEIMIPDGYLPTTFKDEHSEVKYTIYCHLDKVTKTRMVHPQIY